MSTFNPITPLLAVFGAIFAARLTSHLFRYYFVRPWTAEKAAVVCGFAATAALLAQRLFLTN